MKRLGTPYMRGKSEVIRNYAPAGGVAVGEGLVYTLNSTGEMIPFAGTGIPKGVAGALEFKKQSGVEAGLETYVRLADGETPAIGQPAYVKADGTISATSSGNTPINAIFASVAETDCRDSKNTQYTGVALDFVGGF